MTVLMKERSIDLQDAVNCAGEMFKAEMERFFVLKGLLPSWGPSVDRDVERFFLDAMQWVRGNIE